MAKRFKLRISRLLLSFRLCRSKEASNLPEIPVPFIRRLSPVNLKALGVGYRNLKLPAPPPPTPDFSFIKRRLTPKIASVTKDKIEKLRGNASVSLSRRDGGCFGSERAEYEESGTLMSTSRSFWDDTSSFELAEDSHMETKKKKDKKKVSNAMMVKRLKSFGSKKHRGGGPWTAEEKVGESVVVVKRSEDPYEDFKRSMMEMIREKQMLEAEELEQLLRCFLWLNSREYRAVIVEAFTEIWEALFPHCGCAQ
ncbi:ARABIDOPSIS THALIANA OVATE FAMILY PROTEIN 7, ovate family protein 7 [Hibiscus trionum]|uniref:Transcription repressor n=1 Tax=Hibiscus trionum TaxID=183268 RepID=A0A9W7MAR7_HIBTR|nr:ARABIDOPSIS THALIANA OVATE FAMILY PROTEIN 7, ovate family protein 7 [Hibiscus trionum]